MKLAVVGTGYVGLVAGTCFAESGNDVICVDIDEAKIAMLRKGEIPIYEPGLQELVQRNQEEQRLVFTTELDEAVRRSDIVFVAVGTPQTANGEANLDYVRSTAEGIARAMNAFKIVVLKSTVPVGTADLVRGWIAGITPHRFAVVSNPEFLKEGAAIEDFMKPDRVVLGGDDAEALEAIKELYEPFVRTGNPILVMDSRSAEMSKYAANAMLATKISFINEVSLLCERTGADVNEVRRAIGLDRRIGPHFIFPGVGYGGSCFPKDVRAMISMGGDAPEMLLLKAVEQVNERQKRVLVEKVKRHFGDRLQGLTFAVWGLAFKPRTDDMRDAPSITIIEALLQAGAAVQAYDPEAMGEARKIFGERIRYSRRSYEALRDASALLVMTEWNEFRRPDFQRIKELLKTPVIFDGRNLYDPADLQRLGFRYYSIGRRDG
ncbi:MAG TPA: UDP-glucose/GDP-mannose dehydrogenase family protein [candidate division Zixibacteria bacterium]|nr:UDP-glucose/GDP-mannose dehydrogenase family protein [candidate division Zixibacteria bacterium]